MDHLRLFNGDTTTKQALIAYIFQHIDSVALIRMYKGEDVSHIADAVTLINSAFEALEQEYAPARTPIEATNQSR